MLQRQRALIPRRQIVRAPLGVVAGYVSLVLQDAETGRVVRKLGPFRNLITDAALNYMGNGAVSTVGFNGYATTFAMAASTDSTAPAVGDTVLAGEITPAATHRTIDLTGTPTSSITYVAGTPDYYSYKHSRKFATTQANGTITKLGFLTASTGGTLLAETLIKDVGGTPTSIVKTSTQTLTVLWEFRWYLPQSDTVTTPTINGVVYTLTARAANVNNGATGWGSVFGSRSLPDIFGFTWDTAATGGTSIAQPTSALVARGATPTKVASTNTIALLAYVAGNFFRDVTFSCASTVTALMFGPFGAGATACMQLGFSPVLPAGQQITIRLSWGRFP